MPMEDMSARLAQKLAMFVQVAAIVMHITPDLVIATGMRVNWRQICSHRIELHSFHPVRCHKEVMLPPLFDKDSQLDIDDEDGDINFLS